MAKTLSSSEQQRELPAQLASRFRFDAETGRLSYADNASALLPAGPTIIARHGETHVNLLHDAEGWANSGMNDGLNQLTDRGHRQASRLASSVMLRLARSGQPKTVRVICSALNRTRATAEPLVSLLEARGHDVQLAENAALNEIDLGDWNNQVISELPPEEARRLRRFRYDADAFVASNTGEDFSTFLSRIGSFVIRLRDPDPSVTTVLITHSTSITAIRMHALDSSLRDSSGSLCWTGHGLPPATGLYLEPGATDYRTL